jgi:hypothetical protein
MDMTARLTYVPRDPHVITVTITDRAGAEGHHVGGGELGRAEQAQRQHGHPHATFPGYESCEQQPSPDG